MKRNIVIAVVTAAALVGGGTATALAVSGDDGGPAPVAQTETRVGDDDERDDDKRDDDGQDDDTRDDDRDERAASADVTAADAIAAALKHTPGTAVSAELDDDDDDGDNGGKAVWEVDVLGGGDTWHSVRVDPGTGKVLGVQKDDEDDTAEVRAALKGTSVTAEEAAKAAAAKGTVTSVDLDDDDDKEWEAETRASGGDERDWRVDLSSGKVTADQKDDSDDD